MELVRFPKAAENVTEGTVGRWLAQPGQRVAAGQPLVELITEKAEFELPSPAAGRLAAAFAPERSTVPVGYVLCALAEAGEALPDVAELNAEAVAAHQAALLGAPAAAPSPDRPAPAASAADKVAATPAARRLAGEHGLDLREVAAKTGKSGLISESDVRRHLEARAGGDAGRA